MKKRRYLGVNEKGHLVFSGCDTIALAAQYGTPLYVMSEDELRQRCGEIRVSLLNQYPRAKALYASKAFACKAMYKIMEEEGMCVDVVSSGEFYTALAAGFPAERVYFHGNNKSKEEIEFAIHHNVGCIIIDNFQEIDLVQQVAEAMDKKVNALLRISPGVFGHTHNYISTGQLDSKFGFPIAYGIAMRAVKEVLRQDNIVWKGLHCHIGSQMFDKGVYREGIERMAELMEEIKKRYNVEAEELNVGGGFGIYYVEGDRPLDISVFMNTIIKSVKEECKDRNLTWPTILVEPGRWMTGEAGITLYTAGTIKNIPDVRKYVSVDGGMADNPRPELYQAKYEAVVCNRADEPCVERVAIAGKCCETDVMIWDAEVPEIEAGDIIAVLGTGAYCYSMSSNYNRLRKPPVVMVHNGKSRVVVKRETYEDLIRNDLD